MWLLVDARDDCSDDLIWADAAGKLMGILCGALFGACVGWRSGWLELELVCSAASAISSHVVTSAPAVQSADPEIPAATAPPLH